MGSSFGYESSHVLRGRVSIGDIFVRGSVFFLSMRDVVRTFCIFSFLSFSDTLFLHCDSKPCTHFLCLYILSFLLQFHLSLHVLFLFSLYAHASYLLYAVFYFWFTLRCRDEFCLKCFRNTGCQSLSCHELLLVKFFKGLC